jgi:glucose/arabinose dehydrogenase
MRFLFFTPLGLVAGIAMYFGLTANWIVPKHKVYETSAGSVAVEQVAGPFSHPWAVAFLPGGAMLVTERGGRLWRVDEERSRTEVAGAPAVKAERQGGLLDVVAARDFAETREIFRTRERHEPNGSRRRPPQR